MEYKLEIDEEWNLLSVLIWSKSFKGNFEYNFEGQAKSKTKKQFVYTKCSELAVLMYLTGKSMNNLLSYCGIVDERISASEKDLLVLSWGRLFKTKV